MRSNAERNGDAWMDTIRQCVAALNHDFDAGPCEIDGNEFKSPEKVRNYISGLPLSGRVRSGWTHVGAKMKAEEYEILLTTDGPALRIVGDLAAYSGPDTARLECRDHGTRWVELRPPADTPVETMQDNERALLLFAQQFYFG